MVNVQMLLEIGSILKPFQSRFSCQFFVVGEFRSRYLGIFLYLGRGSFGRGKAGTKICNQEHVWMTPL